jgi:hypothetical protein
MEIATEISCKQQGKDYAHKKNEAVAKLQFSAAIIPGKCFGSL